MNKEMVDHQKVKILNKLSLKILLDTFGFQLSDIFTQMYYFLMHCETFL